MGQSMQLGEHGVVEALQPVRRDGHVEIVDDTGVFAGYDPTPEQIAHVATVEGLGQLATVALVKETDAFYREVADEGERDITALYGIVNFVRSMNYPDIRGLRGAIPMSWPSLEMWVNDALRDKNYTEEQGE